MALLLLFAFVMSWVGVLLGLTVPSVEVAQQVAFIVIFPITFVSSAFVPVATLPTILQPFAEWNPVSTLTSSLRTLWGNPNPGRLGQLPVAESDPGDAAVGGHHPGRRSRRWPCAATAT